jgi:hypothetical protein
MTRTRTPALLAACFAAAVGTACTTVSDETDTTASAFTGTTDFLARYATNDADHTARYNNVFSDVDDTPAYPDDLASPRTLRDWKRKFMPSGEPVVSAIYRNKRELGEGPAQFLFWRNMTCTKRFVRGGPGGCIVTNFKDDHFDAGDTSGFQNNGTVGMSLTRDGFVHFSLYEPNSGKTEQEDPNDVLSTNLAVLDGEGEKVAPHVCVNCHSGTIDERQDLRQKPDLGSVFREFEPSLLEGYFDGQIGETKLYDLNQAVLAANAALRGESEGAPTGLEHARQAVADHIRDIYAGLGPPASHPNAPFSHAVDDPALVPPSWRAEDTATQNLFSKLVSPYCMECHRHNDFDFADYSNFGFLRDPSGSMSLLMRYVVDDGRNYLTSPPYMPQAQAAFSELQVDPAAWRAIRAWSGLPPLEATVEITADQPGSPPQVTLSPSILYLGELGGMTVRFVNRSTHDLRVTLAGLEGKTGFDKSLPAGIPAPTVEMAANCHGHLDGFDQFTFEVYTTDPHPYYTGLSVHCSR